MCSNTYNINRTLREEARAAGLFRPSAAFYILMLAHVIALEVLPSTLHRVDGESEREEGSEREGEGCCACGGGVRRAVRRWVEERFGGGGRRPARRATAFEPRLPRVRIGMAAPGAGPGAAGKARGRAGRAQ